MTISEKKYFLCTGEVVTYENLFRHPSSHIIGHFQYVTDEGRRVTALARWEVSMPTTEVPPILPDIDVYLIGDARRIKCRAPGCIRVERWEIGKAAFMVLMDRYRKVEEVPT